MSFGSACARMTRLTASSSPDSAAARELEITSASG
ncbi:Uncharacterised protein [Mycobacteroides abscessus subsp. abscessus]|nr:Uncharacterised protein [Mycobacteroides abscessus subsp. abscessus]